MKNWKRKILREDNIGAQFSNGGVPFCSESCLHYDGKRCALLGQRPGHVCEPAVVAMAEILDVEAKT